MHHLPFLPSVLRTRPVAIALLALTLGLQGCTQVYTVKVDSIRTPEVAPRRTYHLVSADPYRDVTRADYVEATATVNAALELNGLFAASRPEWADMVIAVDFGVGPRRWVSVPSTPGRDPAGSSVYLPDRQGGTVAESSGTLAPASALSRVVAMREKHLSLVARENTSTAGQLVASGSELWRVDVSLQDEATTIDGLLPILAASLVDSLDCSTPPGTVKRISARELEVILVSQSH